MSQDEPGKAPARDDEGLYPIRTVASLTGVNPITLRAWERRYGLIRPHRTEKGHRLYTQADIDLINQVVQLLEQGIPISRVRHRLEQSTVPAENGEAPDSDPWHLFRLRMHHAVSRFDEAAVDATYNEALALYPIDTVTRRLLMPLLRELGEIWQQRDSGIAEEHFFATYLRNKLGARFHHQTQGNDGPRLVAACLPEERHELGLMLFALSAAARNYRAVMFGADIPLSQVALAGQRVEGAVGVILSSSVSPSRAVLENELPSLAAALEIPVFIGGETAVRQHDALVRAGTIPLGNEIPAALRRLEEHLGHERKETVG